MTCLIDRCAAVAGCSSHLRLMLEATPNVHAAVVEAALGKLTRALGGLRSASPRAELLACAALLAEWFTVDRSGDADALRADLVLEERRGAPLLLGAITVTAARDAGIALGLLAGPYGRLSVAHATLAEPMILDLDSGFTVNDITGDEPLHRWLCAHETADRLHTELAAPKPRRSGPTATPRARSATPARRAARRRLQPHG